jgi:hypothetical protein
MGRREITVSDEGTEIDLETLQPLPRFFGMPLADRVSTIQVDRLRFAFLLQQALLSCFSRRSLVNPKNPLANGLSITSS